MVARPLRSPVRTRGVGSLGLSLCAARGRVTQVPFAWFTCVAGVVEVGVGVAELPSGTVTFLFTDLEGSTRLWEEHPDSMRPALARRDELVRDAIESHGGYVVKTTGDGFHAAAM